LRNAPPNWTAVASTCAPNLASDTTVFLWLTDGPAVTFQASDTGEIKARCNVANPSNSGVPSWTTLTVGYQDPDGTGLDYEVKVTFWRVNKSTGNYSNIASFDSNNFNSTGATSHHVTFSHAFDFTNDSYFVTLELTRNAAAKDPSVWLVGLN
jgi:hypothetical protein